MHLILHRHRRPIPLLIDIISWNRTSSMKHVQAGVDGKEYLYVFDTRYGIIRVIGTGSRCHGERELQILISRKFFVIRGRDEGFARRKTLRSVKVPVLMDGLRWRVGYKSQK